MNLRLKTEFDISNQSGSGFRSIANCFIFGPCWPVFESILYKLKVNLKRIWIYGAQQRILNKWNDWLNDQ